ncbi:MAG: hypothetical protein NC120_06245 [Ruminococcus sp.]|nr:hypothetical protein [Ruminococcus sp.]
MRGKYSEKQRIAADKFLSENYEQVKFSVRKGKRDKIKELATMKGLSVASLIMSLIEQEAERMGFDMTTAPTPSQQRKLEQSEQTEESEQ